MDQSEVRTRLTRAIKKLLGRDRYLLVHDANERSITHRLAIYLEEEFPGLQVDCEYNRRDFDAKKTLHFYPPDTATNDTDAKTVFPDIIVHTRGPKGPNLLVIEAKKSGNHGHTDHQKLEAYKRDPGLRYEHAVFLEFRTGEANPGVEPPEFIS